MTSYANEADSSVWTPLTTVVLERAEEIVFDKDSPYQPRRFYRAEPKR